MTKKEKAYIKARIAEYRELSDKEFARAEREPDKKKQAEAFDQSYRYNLRANTVQMMLTELETLNIK